MISWTGSCPVVYSTTGYRLSPVSKVQHLNSARQFCNYIGTKHFWSSMASENIHCITSKQFVTILKIFDKDGKKDTNGASILVKHLHGMYPQDLIIILLSLFADLFSYVD